MLSAIVWNSFSVDGAWKPFLCVLIFYTCVFIYGDDNFDLRFGARLQGCKNGENMATLFYFYTETGASIIKICLL